RASIAYTVTVIGGEENETQGDLLRYDTHGENAAIAGNSLELAGHVNVSFTEIERLRVENDPPPAADIIEISPDPRNTPVSAVDAACSEPIASGSSTAAAVSLTRNGSPVALTGLTTSLVAGNTYRIGGLAGFTAADGTYVIGVAPAKVTDLVGNAATGFASDSWTADASGPTANVGPITPAPRTTPVSEGDVVFSQPITRGSFT